MNLVIKQTRIVEVPVSCLSIDATCHNALLIDQAGEVVGRSLTMPAFVPEKFEIDLATGMIRNWQVPTAEQLQAIADLQCNGVPAAEHTINHDTLYPELLDESNAPYGYFDGPAPSLEVAPTAVDDAPITVEASPLPDDSIVIHFDRINKIGMVGEKMTTFQTKKGALKSITFQKFGIQPCFFEDIGCEYIGSTLWDKYSARPAFELTEDHPRIKVKEAPDCSARATCNGVTSTSTGGAKGAIHNILKKMDLQGTVVEITTLDDIEAEVQMFTVLVEESETGTGRSAVKPRYHNATTGETWTGRGKQPAWLITALAEGASLEDFLIDAVPKPKTVPEPTALALETATPDPVTTSTIPTATVSYAEDLGKWSAQFEDQVASSSQNAFEAIKGALKKAGKTGIFAINKMNESGEHTTYSIDGSRTQGCQTIYVTYSDTKNEWTARTSDNKRAASVLSVDGALVALLDEVYGVDPKQACLHETTDDEMRELGKRRYSILHFPVVEKAPEAITVPPVTAPTPPAKPDTTPPSYDELVLAINHASTVNQAAALVGRISKHPNFSQQQSLYALQRKRVDALKAAEQSN